MTLVTAIVVVDVKATAIISGFVHGI